MMETELSRAAGVRDIDMRAALVAGGEAWDTAVVNLAERPDALSGQEFADTDFSERNLAGINFSHCDFYRAKLDKCNLKKSTLQNAELTLASLRNAALYKADLRNAVLQEADLGGADLSEADCRGADFRGAKLSNCLLTGSDLRGCDLSHADLTNANLSGADIAGAKFHFVNFSGANVTHVKYGTFRTLVGNYYGIRGIESTFGNALFVRDAKDQDYIDTLYQSILDKPRGIVRTADLALFWGWSLIDHGRSLAKVALYAFVVATLYGLAYLLDMKLGLQILDYSRSADTWFTPFYFSVVTYTTLGYGDVTAKSLLGEVLVISEVVAGYFTLGLLLAILANTVARRS